MKVIIKITLIDKKNNSYIRLLDFHYGHYVCYYLNLIFHKVLLKALAMDNLTINSLPFFFFPFLF